MARKATGEKRSTAQKSAPKPKRSAFRMDTLISLLLLAALIGFAFYLNREKKIKEAEATPAGTVMNFVFTASDGAVNSIEIRPASGEPFKAARNAAGLWALELPIKAEADQSVLDMAVSQVTALQITSPLPADGDPSIFGFDSPAFILSIGFADGKNHTLEIGDITPSQNGYYVRLDKSSMMIVDAYGIDLMVQLASYPPYLNTPTPSPLPPSETPVQPTGTAPAPEVSVTPAP